MNGRPRKILSLVLALGLFFQQASFAQVAVELNIADHLAIMGNRLLSEKFRPLHLRYFSYDLNSDNFKVLVDKGDFAKGLSPQGTVPEQKLQEETKTLLNYFLVGVTLPDEAFWVNLRPDSENQIIDPWLEQTDVGKIMLEADLQLKKDTALFTSPETPEGRQYWDRLYKKAEELYGYNTATIPTLTRPWIVPGEIIVRESNDSAYVYKAVLKVMLEQDYLKSPQSTVSSSPQNYQFKDERSKALNEYSTQLIRELIIPRLTKEVNSSKRYAPLRQVYYSLILSRWFKARFGSPSPQSIVHSPQNNSYVKLIDSKNLADLTSKTPWSKTAYFKQYQKSFSEGEYNVKEPVYTPTGQVIRSYFSGGITISSPLIRNRFAGEDDPSKFPGISMIGNARDHQRIALQPSTTASSLSPDNEFGERTLSEAKGLLPQSAASPLIQVKYRVSNGQDMREDIEDLKSRLRSQQPYIIIFTREWINASYRNIRQYEDILKQSPSLGEFLELLRFIALPEEAPLSNDYINRVLSDARVRLLDHEDKPIELEYVIDVEDFLREKLATGELHFSVTGLVKQAKPQTPLSAASSLSPDNGVGERTLSAAKGLAPKSAASPLEMNQREEELAGYLNGRLTRSVIENFIKDKPFELVGMQNSFREYEAKATINLSTGELEVIIYVGVAGTEFSNQIMIRFLGEGDALYSKITIENEGDISARLADESIEGVDLDNLADDIVDILNGDISTATSPIQSRWDMQDNPLVLQPGETVIDVLEQLLGDKQTAVLGMEFTEGQRRIRLFASKEISDDRKGGNRKEHILYGDKFTREPIKHVFAVPLSGFHVVHKSNGSTTTITATRKVAGSPVKTPDGSFIIAQEYRDKINKMTQDLLVLDPQDVSGNVDKIRQFEEQLIPIVQEALAAWPTYKTVLNAIKFALTASLDDKIIVSTQLSDSLFKNEARYYLLVVEALLDENYTQKSSRDLMKTIEEKTRGLMPEKRERETASRVPYFMTSSEKELLKAGIVALHIYPQDKALLKEARDSSDYLTHAGKVYTSGGYFLVIMNRLFSQANEKLNLASSAVEGPEVNGAWHNKDLLRKAFLGLRESSEIIKDKTEKGAKRRTLTLESGWQIIMRDDEGYPVETTVHLFSPDNEEDAFFSIKYSEDKLNMDRWQVKDDLEYLIVKRMNLASSPVSASGIDASLRPSSSSGLRSASMPEERKTGGIDFRALPMTIRPMGSFSGLNFNLPRLSRAELERINVTFEMQEIGKMVQAGILPSGERIKELVAACVQKGEITHCADNLLLCLIDVCKLQEEGACDSSPEFREALVIVDSQA